ncbi:MAG: hypothetical protein AB7O43_10740 [Hyphomicrobiaceae bacterium]
MRSFIVACVAALVIAVASVYLLEAYQEPAETAFVSPTGVRL